MGQGDFERAYAEHAESLFAFLIYRTGDRVLAEDIVADTFERALRARRGFNRRRGSEKTWLYSIALNRLRDHARREGVHGRAVELLGHDVGEDEGEAALERVEARDALGAALAKLAPEEREAIALRFGGDLTLRQIAKLTGEPMTTVEGRVYRALRKLRETLT